MSAFIISSVLLVLGACVALLNWVYVVANFRLQRQRSDRRISTVPWVTQILVALAAIAASQAISPSLPSWLFWLVAFSDPALARLVLLLGRRVLSKVS